MNIDNEVVDSADSLSGWINGVSTQTRELARNVASLLEHNLPGKSKFDKAELVGLDDCPGADCATAQGSAPYRGRRSGVGQQGS
jgi:hypothetical protein